MKQINDLLKAERRQNVNYKRVRCLLKTHIIRAILSKS